jgi:hypothetical protein
VAWGNGDRLRGGSARINPMQKLITSLILASASACDLGNEKDGDFDLAVKCQKKKKVSVAPGLSEVTCNR